MEIQSDQERSTELKEKKIDISTSNISIKVNHEKFNSSLLMLKEHKVDLDKNY